MTLMLSVVLNLTAATMALGYSLKAN